MQKLLSETQKSFESSSSRTPEYMAWHKLFRKEFGKFLKNNGAIDFLLSKPNHFDASGFFTMANNQIYYFRVEDLRWSKDNMLIRTAKNFKDYTGGMNRFVGLKSEEEFVNDFKRITAQI